MTRKRFVKQLMASGIQRNEANAIALLRYTKDRTYRKKLVKRHERMAMEKYTGIIVPVVRQIIAVAVEAAKAVENAVSTICARLNETPGLYGGGGND